jgi:hypothetical protein
LAFFAAFFGAFFAFAIAITPFQMGWMMFEKSFMHTLCVQK